MENPVNYEPEDDSGNGLYCWWRSASEFQGTGRLDIDISRAAEAGPRMRVLREMERLAMVAPEGLDDLRHKLLSYRPGDFWVPMGGLKKEELDIPPIVTILLVGFSKSGKSSLVNLMYSVLGRAGLIPFAQTAGSSSNYETLFMEEHNVLRSMRNGFCVYDSRGLSYYEITQSLEELSEWMIDGVHHHLRCSRGRGSESSDGFALSAQLSSSKFTRRRVNCAVVVVDMSYVYKSLIAGDSTPLEATKELFCSHSLRKCNENPILILSHGDLLNTDERIDGRIKICQFLGISETTGVYDISCVTEHGFLPEEADPVSAYALTEALYRVLLFSDRTHPPGRRWKDHIVEFLYWILCCISAFFAFLAYYFSKLGKQKMKRL
ncbi:uncharacterized protein LOC116253835 [Nymphaea colorata]|nr:uncharacterized protein LOC116253835 [Nymphaea colorata]